MAWPFPHVSLKRTGRSNVSNVSFLLYVHDYKAPYMGDVSTRAWLGREEESPTGVHVNGKPEST